MTGVVCAYCGSSMPEHRRVDQIYCSGRCRTAACRARARTTPDPSEARRAVTTRLEGVTEVVGGVDLREPACRHSDHRGQDWAMPSAEVWICGVCFPPSERLRTAYPLIHRIGGPEVPRRQAPDTFASAYDRWQRSADL